MDMAKIEGDEIVIRLSLDTLVTATDACPAFTEQYDEATDSYRRAEVADRAVWAREVVRELNSESEDGTTLVHLMFDKAFLQAAEQGAEGIRLPGDEL